MNDQHDHHDPVDTKLSNADRLEQLKHANRATTITASSIKRRHITVKAVQIGLPILALTLMVAIILFDGQGEDTITALNKDETTPQIQQEIGKNELVKPHFESVDNKGQPFSITAARAVQENPDGTGGMALDNPEGILSLNDGETITIKSLQGIYLQDEDYLELNQNVNLHHSAGYTLTTQRLNLDTKTKRAWSNLPVQITADIGDATGAGINFETDTQTLKLIGPAKATLYLDRDL